MSSICLYIVMVRLQQVNHGEDLKPKAAVLKMMFCRGHFRNKKEEEDRYEDSTRPDSEEDIHEHPGSGGASRSCHHTQT
jgi:hypothetical protein